MVSSFLPRTKSLDTEEEGKREITWKKVEFVEAMRMSLEPEVSQGSRLPEAQQFPNRKFSNDKRQSGKMWMIFTNSAVSPKLQAWIDHGQNFNLSIYHLLLFYKSKIFFFT